MPPRVAVITGASSGIGLATAVALARSGLTVVGTMRDPCRADDLLNAAKAASVDVDVLPLDVTDDDSVTSCIGSVLDRYQSVDVLVNNAGIGYGGTLEELDMADFRRSLDVNFLGAARTTKAVLPSMRAAGSGHLIAVSSIAGVFGQPFNDAYCAAKFALEGLYESLGPVAAAFGIHVSVVEAGPVQGNFVERSGGVQHHGSSGLFDHLRRKFSAVADLGYQSAETPQQVAEVIVGIANNPAPNPRYQTSSSVERLLAIKLKDLSGERTQRLTKSWLE
jgi:NAD(P)-dependent dehydrogenase (short-subunit alcohol dehydrogenase family)